MLAPCPQISCGFGGSPFSEANAGQIMSAPFASKNGLPPNPQEIWGHGATISGAAMKDYAEQIQKVTLDYIATLSDADLDRQVDTQFFGMQSLAFLIQLASMHATGHAGDVAAVKGMQGLKGLPF